MKTILRAGAAGLLISLWLAATAGAVLVRVEGETATLLPRTPVTQTDDPDTDCPADSAANALEIATEGNWDRQPFVQTILGETHDFSDNDYWNVWVFRGGAFKVGNGICDERLVTGEELLLSYQQADPMTFANQIFPMWLADVPATVTAGTPFTVRVLRAACETDGCLPGEGHAEPAAGATVTAGGTTATAGADGVATLTLTASGPATLRATQAQRNPSATESTVVRDPGGYEIPPEPTPPGPGGGPAPDTTKPAVAIKRLRKRYRGRGPRRLRARLSDAGGIADAQLALTRKRGRRGERRCAGFGERKGRLRKIRCGRRLLFSVGAQERVSFLLPRRLQRGRYRFDVVAVDAAGNRTAAHKRFRVRRR